MTPTQDEHDVRDWLHGTAERTPLRPLDSARLLERGRRGRLRRRLFASAGATATVAAVAVAATLLPDLNGTDRVAPAASPTPSKTATQRSGDFTPVPGVPHGEAALAQLSTEEATRRCLIRYPGIRRPLDSIFLRTGFPVRYTPAIGQRDQSCTIPGDSRPSAALVAAAVADPLPSTPAGILRNCSVLMWHDLTAWRVATFDRQPGVQLIAVVLSPSGKHVANCHLTPEGYRGTANYGTGVSGTWATATYGRQELEHFGGQGTQRCADSGSSNCMGWQYYDAGRVDSKIARIRVTAKNGRAHDIAVRDGWFAFAWADGNPSGGPDPTVMAYDAKGRQVFP